MRKKYNIIIVLLVVTLEIFSQDYKTDVLRVSKYLLNLKNYALVMDYKIYLDDDLSKPFQQRKVEIKRNEKCVYVNQNSVVEVVDNENYQIMVNNKNKVFTALKKTPTNDDRGAKLKEFTSTLDQNTDTLMMLYDKITLLEKTNAIVKYKLTYKGNEEVDHVLLTIDKKTNMYKEIFIKYKKDRKVNELNGTNHKVTLRITYEGFKPNSIHGSEFFDEKKYIVVNKQGKIEPVKKFAGYKLILPENEL